MVVVAAGVPLSSHDFFKSELVYVEGAGVLSCRFVADVVKCLLVGRPLSLVVRCRNTLGQP